MRRERVFITGMGAVSPYGEGTEVLTAGIAHGRCALSIVPGTPRRVAGRIPAIDEKRLPRAVRRTMSPMGLYATLAAQEALAQAHLSGRTERIGLALASTMGSPLVLEDFFTHYCERRTLDDVKSTVFFKVMSHTVAANVALACHCTGRTLAPAAACSTGLVALSLGFEAIAFGREQCMLCGGADEYHPLTRATFDRLGAASAQTDPLHASLPFDRDRSGVVCSEGAGVLLLESLAHALARRAKIYGEILGCGMGSAATSIAHPSEEAIVACMQDALADAHIAPRDLTYCNAHATGTDMGDIAEGQAIARVLGDTIPTSSLKGHMGHTMAASGVLECIAVLCLLGQGMLPTTLGLVRPDPACGRLNLLHTASGTPTLVKHSHPMPLVLKNSFALGGIHSCLVFRVGDPT